MKSIGATGGKLKFWGQAPCPVPPRNATGSATVIDNGGLS